VGEKRVATTQTFDSSKPLSFGFNPLVESTFVVPKPGGGQEVVDCFRF
jgi:hypothetical protein